METETHTYTPAPPRLAPPVAPTAPARHVRVTITGKAHQLTHAPNLLRVQASEGRTILVDTRDAGVEVENVPAPVTWTPRDVVELSGHVFVRDEHGTWRCPELELVELDDNTVEQKLRDGATLVRCQHTEQLRELVLS